MSFKNQHPMPISAPWCSPSPTQAMQFAKQLFSMICDFCVDQRWICLAMTSLAEVKWRDVVDMHITLSVSCATPVKMDLRFFRKWSWLTNDPRRYEPDERSSGLGSLRVSPPYNVGDGNTAWQPNKNRIILATLEGCRATTTLPTDRQVNIVEAWPFVATLLQNESQMNPPLGSNARVINWWSVIYN